MAVTTPHIEIGQPKKFTTGAILMSSAYGLFLAAPIFISVLIISVLKFGILTFLVPFLAILVTAFFLPFGLGNAYVVRLVRSINPAAGTTPDSFIVQLTLWPRIRSGMRAVIDDADDVGLLSFTDSALVFQGDSINLSVPFDEIKEFRPQNVGLRGRFVYGRRISVVVSGLPNVESLEFVERSSWLLPASRATTKRLYERLSAKIKSKEPNGKAKDQKGIAL